MPVLKTIHDLLGFGIQRREETLVEFLGCQRQFLLDHVGSGHVGAEIVHHGQQLGVTPLVRDEAADAPGLIVGDHHLAGITGMHKAAIKFRHRQ